MEKRQNGSDTSRIKTHKKKRESDYPIELRLTMVSGLSIPLFEARKAKQKEAEVFSR